MRVSISCIKCKGTHLLSSGVVLHIGLQTRIHESNHSHKYFNSLTKFFFRKKWIFFYRYSFNVYIFIVLCQKVFSLYIFLIGDLNYFFNKKKTLDLCALTLISTAFWKINKRECRILELELCIYGEQWIRRTSLSKKLVRWIR